MKLRHYVAKGLNVSCANIAGTAFIYMEDTKLIASLDEVGTFIWTLANGRRTIAYIVSRCLQEYDAERSEIRNAVMEFLVELEHFGALTVSTTPFEGVLANA